MKFEVIIKVINKVLGEGEKVLSEGEGVKYVKRIVKQVI